MERLGVPAMLRFTIRDMLWLTVMVAVGVTWSIDHSRLAATNDELMQQRSAEVRFAKLRARELDRKAIIDPFQ
jgi:hypothetical protein